MNYKQKLTIFFYIIIFSISIYISGIYAIPSIVFSLAFYWVIAYFLYWMYKKLISKTFTIFSKENYKIFLNEFLYKTWIIIVLLITILWSFSYYQNEISPARMPTYTITNWEKTLVFQTMSHIWSQDFYDKVKEKITEYKKNWYVLYFEWVRPWTKENHEAFDKALWVKFDENTYENMSKLYWLVNQNNEMFLGLVNDKDYNVDVSIDDIMNDYQDLKKQNWTQNREYQVPLDAWELIINELSKLKENELKVLRYINKAFVNVIVKSPELQSSIQNNFANQELFEVILNKRNQIIADKIINSEDKNIIATYWMLHFDWIFKILKQNDIKWKITRIDYLTPIQ